MLQLNTNDKALNAIPYKFAFDESVIFIDLQKGIARTGTVVSIHTYQDKQNRAVNYTLYDAQTESMIGNVPETVMFRTRDECLNWAIDIANSI